MKPNRYPYSGEIKESTFVKADSRFVKNTLKNSSYLENLLATKV